MIREEALDALNNMRRLPFEDDDSYLLDGTHKVLYLRKGAKFDNAVCRSHFQQTCDILETVFDEASCTKDEVSYKNLLIFTAIDALFFRRILPKARISVLPFLHFRFI